MVDKTAAIARRMNVIEAIVKELDRQGVIDVLAQRSFDVAALAMVAEQAADGAIISSISRTPTHKM
jgi:hypothetical protein